MLKAGPDPARRRSGSALVAAKQVKGETPCLQNQDLTRHCEGLCIPLGNLLLGLANGVGPGQGPFPVVLVGDSEQLYVVCLYRERGVYSFFPVLRQVQFALTTFVAEAIDRMYVKLTNSDGMLLAALWSSDQW